MVDADELELEGADFVHRQVLRIPEGVADDGRVYVYTRTATTWTQAYRFSSENAVAGEYGYALATDGTRLVVGAPTVASCGVSGTGAAFTYDLDGSQISTGQRLTAISPSSDLRFGTVVAIDGTWIAVAGPRRAGAGGRPPGEVVVFQR